MGSSALFFCRLLGGGCSRPGWRCRENALVKMGRSSFRHDVQPDEVGYPSNIGRVFDVTTNPGWKSNVASFVSVPVFFSLWLFILHHLHRYLNLLHSPLSSYRATVDAIHSAHSDFGISCLLHSVMGGFQKIAGVRACFTGQYLKRSIHVSVVHRTKKSFPRP